MCAALHVHPNSTRGWMEKDVVCHLECPWFGGCLAITVLTVISIWCPLFKLVCPWIKNQHMCIWMYHQQFGLCLMAMDFLFLNLQTVLLCTLMTKPVFLQTTKNSSHQLRLFHLLQRHWWSDGCNAYEARSWAVLAIHWCFKEKS
jgi:hypothetical protein